MDFERSTNDPLPEVQVIIAVLYGIDLDSIWHMNYGCTTAVIERQVDQTMFSGKVQELCTASLEWGVERLFTKLCDLRHSFPVYDFMDHTAEVSARELSIVTIDTHIRLLRKEHIRRIRHYAGLPVDSTAPTLQPASNDKSKRLNEEPAPKRRRLGNQNCFKCGNVGHVALNCTSNNVPEGPGSSDDVGGLGRKCFICGEAGHVARNCTARAGKVEGMHSSADASAKPTKRGNRSSLRHRRGSDD